MKNGKRRENFELRVLDISHNDFVQSREAWYALCDTFIFNVDCPYIEELNISHMDLKD